MKKILFVIVFVITGFVGMSTIAFCDSFNISLVPVGSRGVIIDTDTVNMGVLEPSSTYYLSDVGGGIPVISTGTIADIEYTIAASTTNNVITLSNDGQADSADEVVLNVLFNTVSPLITAWETGGVTKNLVTFGEQEVGDGSPGKYEGDQDMDNLGLNVNRTLWFRIKTPPFWTKVTPEIIKVTITAEPAD